jgi:DNA-binding CsgD family transcriptional regulator
VDERELALVELIYEAAGAPERWADVVRQVGALTGASGGLLFTPAIPARDGGLAAGVGLDPDGFRAYEAHFYAKDLWTNEAAARGRDARGAVLTGPMIVGEARFRRSEFFNDFLAPIDLGQLCVAILDDGTSAEMPRIHLSLYRSPRAGPFDERARATLARLLPHLQRATALGRRLQQAMPAWSLALLERLPWAVLLLDGARRLLHANAAGQALLAARDGLASAGGRLTATTAADAKRLHAVVARAAVGGEAGGDLMVARPSGRRPLLVTAVRLSAEGAETVGSRPARVAVFVVDPDILPPGVEQRLGCLLGLTAAEQRVARGLLEGLTLAEVAERNGVSRETVRTQLRAMLAKTATRRQGELLMVLQRALALPAVRPVRR